MFVTYAKKEQTPLRKGRAAGIIKATPRNLRCCFKTGFEAGKAKRYVGYGSESKTPFFLCEKRFFDPKTRRHRCLLKWRCLFFCGAIGYHREEADL
jgi:hypothetical protein